MDIHHGLNGSRRVSVERADHSRIVAERGGRGYVQHPYMYHGHEYGSRRYYDHGRYYDRYYGRYGYRGAYLDVYAPGVYYAPAFYGWAYNPWATPVVYAGWGWAGSPWYGVYGAWFTPFPVYASASFWLTDYLIAASLQAAYAAQVDAQIAASVNPDASPLTPEVKNMIADEVKRQIALENSESAQNAQGQDIDSGSSGIARMMSDGQPHVFVAGSDLDLVADSGHSNRPIQQRRQGMRQEHECDRRLHRSAGHAEPHARDHRQGHGGNEGQAGQRRIAFRSALCAGRAHAVCLRCGSASARPQRSC
jgi:hypothetical protein